MSGIDRRGIAILSVGHGCADLCQGAVPALLPFLVARDGLSLTAAAALLSAATIGSSIVQPLFGLLADRLSSPVLLPIGSRPGASGWGARAWPAPTRCSPARLSPRASASRRSIPRARGWPAASRATSGLAA